MEKLLRVAEMRDLETKVSKEEISYSRMVEIINEKHFLKLVELRQELDIKSKLNELRHKTAYFIRTTMAKMNASVASDEIIDFLIKEIK